MVTRLAICASLIILKFSYFIGTTFESTFLVHCVKKSTAEHYVFLHPIVIYFLDVAIAKYINVFM